jgi:hypothetical protein
VDVKGAKALSQRLAEAARNVDSTPAQAVGSGESERGPEVADRAAKGVTAASRGLGLGTPRRGNRF